MAYIHVLPTTTSFEDRGLLGYTFGPLRQRDLDIYYIEVTKGHDTFMISKKIARLYYVLCGRGYFTIADHRYDVEPGVLVEVPPKVEYSYSGNMKLIAFCRPRWFYGNDTHTKWNTDVVSADLPWVEDGRSLITRLTRLTIFGKSPVNAFLRLNRALWTRLPASLHSLAPARSYGTLLHKIARAVEVRRQAHSTLFFRNRPQLELLRRLVERSAKTEILKVAVLGCSTGAEAYSIAWTIRSMRPKPKLVLQAVDISSRAVEVGKSGVYSLITPHLTPTDIFERMTEKEMNELFDRNQDTVAVKSWIKEGIRWCVGDVAGPEILDSVGPQDVVVANNFLCHMHPLMAEKCLRNIARLVRSQGYLLVSGIDLDVRTKVADELGWHPLEELIEEIHEGDPCMKTFWPWHYAGLEPLDKKRQDWKLRYTTAFQLIPCGENAENQGSTKMLA